MCRFTSICLTLAVLTACLVPGTELWARGGRGGFKGSGGGGFKGSANFRGKGGSKSGSGSIDRGKRKPTFSRSLNRNSTTGFSSRGDQPWSKHQAREQFKLDQRQQVADHLRETSDRNGNEQLKQVADDMDLRAQSHYDKQMEKIKQQYGLGDTAADAGDSPNNVDDNRLVGEGNALADPGEVLNGSDAALDEVARKLTGLREAAAELSAHWFVGGGVAEIPGEIGSHAVDLVSHTSRSKHENGAWGPIGRCHRNDLHPAPRTLHLTENEKYESERQSGPELLRRGGKRI
jgi:hypothetical protein